MRRPFTPLMAIPLEGWAVLLGLALAALSAYSAEDFVLVAVTLALTVPALYWFSDRNRGVLSRPRGILAPVDGTVVLRRECYDPILQREAVRLVLRIDFWAGYSFRAPVEGSVDPLPAPWEARSSLIRTDEGEELIIRVAKGWLFGARPVWMPYGERVGQGRRCGVRRLARQLEVLLPSNTRVEVELGQHVRCGETLIATLLRRET